MNELIVEVVKAEDNKRYKSFIGKEFDVIDNSEASSYYSLTKAESLTGIF